MKSACVVASGFHFPLEWIFKPNRHATAAPQDLVNEGNCHYKAIPWTIQVSSIQLTGIDAIRTCPLKLPARAGQGALRAVDRSENEIRTRIKLGEVKVTGLSQFEEIHRSETHSFSPELAPRRPGDKLKQRWDASPRR